MADITKTSRLQTSSLTGNLEILYGVALLTQLPAAMGYFKRVWSSGHYQFAVLLIPVVVLMMKWKLEKFQISQPGNRYVLNVLLLATMGMMILSTFVAPMFWILAFMSLILCYVYDKYGQAGIRAILPIWLILIVVVPLPRGLDNLLVTKLQGIASEFASWILDALGLVHFRSGVVLVTLKEQFFTEEACSGIRSLFSSLGAIAIYCVHNKYRLWRCLFNLVQTSFWVLIGNAIRIAIVVWVTDNWTTKLVSGWPHEMLGLFTFLLIILLAISTDRILQVFVGMRKTKVAVDENFGEPVIDGIVTDQNKPARPVVTILVFIVLCGFLALCGIRLMTSKTEGFLRNPLFDMPAFPSSAAADLPSKIGNWELQEFESIYRGEEQILSAQSYTWRYKNGDVSVVVSVDGPWEFWHDITACYRGIGWTTDTTHQFGSSEDASDSDLKNTNFSRIELSKVTGEEAIVFFAQHDLEGRTVRPSMLGGLVSLELMKLNFLSSVRTIFGIKTRLDSSYRQYKLPLSTIQLFCDNRQPLTEAQLQEIEEFYFQTRRLLLASPRFAGE